MRHSETIRRRTGFTMIELLVVIGILLVMAGLLLAAIMKVKDIGPRTQVKAEIGQMGIAVENFKSTYNVGYVPSCLIITNDYTQGPGSVALADSRQYISRVWPKGISGGQTGLPAGWSQKLDGNQVLVFLLGGMPPDYKGFMNSPTNPFRVPADGSQGRAFYDFKADRLVANSASEIPHYLDFYGQPYLYFSSVNGGDYDYFGKRYWDIAPDKVTQNSDSFRVPGMTLEGGYGNQANYTQMHPFRGIDGKYINPNGFQIVSMGKDLKAGRGSPCSSPNSWQPAASPWPVRTCTSWMLYDPGVGDYSPGNTGGDDIGNFGSGQLGNS